MAHHSSARLLALHALRLKGIAEADVVADMMDLDPATAAAELDELVAVDLARHRAGRIAGYQLTPEGRIHGQRMLTEELDEAGVRPAIEAAYQQFLRFNAELLEVCTAWQLRPVDGENTVNDHSDAAYDDSVRDRLATVHGKVLPVVEALGDALARFGPHGRRLQTALDHVAAGDDDWFTKPMFPSYHSTWFELHEDLLATLGTERASEGAV